jgi:hypothetical protein
VAQLIGMAASALWLDSTMFKGPFSSATNGADLSVFMGLLFGGGIYYLLERQAVARENDQLLLLQEAPSA